MKPKMTDDEIKKLLDINAKAAFLLGMASVLLDKFFKYADQEEKDRCKKLFHAIDKLYYEVEKS